VSTRRRTPPPRSANQTTQTQKRKRSKIKLPFLTPLSIVAFAVGLGFGWYLGKGKQGIDDGIKSAAYDLDPSLLNGQRILVLGTDQTSGSTDVMFTIESNGDKTQINQIPRDTFINSPRYGILKANALYTTGGPEVAEIDIGKILNQKIDHYARINLEGVRRVSDALGGVEINVPIRMKYDDNTQKLHIDLHPGKQILKGKDLEGYIRFRHDGLGDIGRMERQREVFKAVFRDVLSAKSLFHLPELIEISRDDIKTDLSPLELGAMLGLMKGNHLVISRLEGKPVMYKDLSYWLPAGQLLP
jgi:LCP family protein required for cell wall assembly